MQGFNIDDFQWLEYYPGQASRYPELTVDTDRIHFNVATLKKLGSPSSIGVLFDPDGKRIALKGMKKKGTLTIDLPLERKSRDFAIYSQDKVHFLRDMMPGWDKNTRYKIKGAFYEEENVVVYDLKEAEVFKGGSFPGKTKK